MLTEGALLSYNVKMQGLRSAKRDLSTENSVPLSAAVRVHSKPKEVYRNEKNLSTQETPQKDGAWFPQENGNQQRPQGSCPQTCQGQKAADLLSTAHSNMTR